MKEQEKNRKPYMVILMSKKVNIFHRIYCYAVFTNTEIVIAHIDKAREVKLLNSFKNERKGMEYSFSEMDFVNFLREYGQRYYAIPIEEILKEDERNICLLYINIVQMLFKASKRLDSFMSKEEGIYTLQTKNKKLKFTHYYRDWNRNIYHALFSLYCGKLEYREGDMPLSPVFKEGSKGFF